MSQTTLVATQKGQLKKAKRMSMSVRLEVDDHAELGQVADSEQRSMGFIALRRYLKGRDIELAEQNQS